MVLFRVPFQGLGFGWAFISMFARFYRGLIELQKGVVGLVLPPYCNSLLNCYQVVWLLVVPRCCF